MKQRLPASVIVFFLLSGLIAPNLIYAQSDTRGTDFWVCFPQNAKTEFNAFIKFKLFITGDQAAKGSVMIPSLNKTIPFSINASEIISIDIDTAMQIVSSGIIENSGIHVISDHPVAVYGLSNRKASTDTYVAYPTNVLGTAYRAMCYDPLVSAEVQFTSQITIVAVEDNTMVSVDPTANTKDGKLAGRNFNVTLQRGQTYQLQGATHGDGRSDLTGSLVTSTKPIAFFTGHTCAQVPKNVNFCDQLLEEEPPINSWGKQFFLGKMIGKQEYALRAVASEPDTKIFLNSRLVATLGAGEFYANDHVADNALVTSNNPILVGQYAQSSDADTVKVGDPFLMLIAPTEQFLQSYRFATPVAGSWNHYITVVVPLNAMNSLRLDGLGISSSKFKSIGITRFAIGQVEVGFGSHSISCDRPFGLYSYGFGVGSDNYDSYGNCAGQRVAPIERMADTSKPTLELAQTIDASEIVLIARDDRINDLGLATIMITDSSDQANPVSYPVFDVGAPQFRFSIKKPELTSCLTIKIQDFAKNQSSYALCPAAPNSSEAAKYILTPTLVQQMVEHESYPVEVYPSPATYGQVVNFTFTNSLPESISAQVFDEGGNIVTELQKKQPTGSGKHSLIYRSDKYAAGSYFLRFTAYSADNQVVYKQDVHFVVVH